MKRVLAAAALLASGLFIGHAMQGDASPSDCLALYDSGVLLYGSPQCAVTTTTGAPTTTAQTTTTAQATTTTGATTTTVAATTTTVASGGTFTDSFASLANWSFAHWRNEIPGNGSAASTATIVSGQARISAADQNYGDATLRSHTRYDLSSGEFRVTLSDNTEGWPLLGSVWVGFSELPQPAPSLNCCNGTPPIMRNGVAVHLRDNCRVPNGPPIAFIYTNWVETNTWQGSGQCLTGQPSGPVELRYQAGVMRLYAGGVLYWQQNVAIPTTGYILLGVHNHASEKYSDGPGPMPAVIGVFDNVSYPAAPAAAVAYVTFNAYSLNPSNPTVTVNGHAHTFTPHETGSHSYSEAIAVPLSEVLPSGNVVTVTGFTVVGNVELVN